MKVAEAAEGRAALVAVLEWEPTVVVITPELGGPLAADQMLWLMRKLAPTLRCVVRSGCTTWVSTLHAAGEWAVMLQEPDLDEELAAISTAHTRAKQAGCP